MPDVEGAEYLVSYWQSLGKCSAGAMGAIPLSPTEIAAWQKGTQTALLPFEFTALLEMSRGYVSMLHEGEKPECLPPYGDPIKDFDREALGKKVSNAFKAFLQAKRK